MPRSWMLLGYCLAALLAALPAASRGEEAASNKSPGAEIKEAGRTIGHGAATAGKGIAKGAKTAGKEVAKGARQIGHGVRDAVKGK